jgi:hypothetical protein
MTAAYWIIAGLLVGNLLFLSVVTFVSAFVQWINPIEAADWITTTFGRGLILIWNVFVLGAQMQCIFEAME